MKNTKKGMSVGKVVAIGAGVAALGAGAYYLLGPDGKKNQKKVHAWAVKMEKEAEKKIKAVKNATAPMYHKVVDALSATYTEQYKEHAPEVKAFAKALKSKWKMMEKKSKPAVKKAVKKVMKMTAKPKNKKK